MPTKFAASRVSIVRHSMRAQQGAALLIMLGAIILLTSAIILSKLNAAVAPTPNRDPGTTETLARAKEALIAWAATHPDTPGLLPFPDRNDDGAPNYDGAADCVAAGTVGPAHLLGSFPIRGEVLADGCTADVSMSVETTDSSHQRLWYAVSQNLVRGGDGGLVNPDIGELGVHPWITVRNQFGIVISNRVAAVIIAPGAALGGQDRSSIAAAASNYLESFSVGATTYDNADADGCPDALTAPCVATPGEEFIVNPTPAAEDNFNDRLVFVTVDEIMAAVQDRVLGDAALAMKSYRGSYTVAAPLYPWMAPFSNPRSLQGIATGGSAIRLDGDGTDFGAPPVVNSGDLVRNLTDGSTGTVAAVDVPSTSLILDGLAGGTSNVFANGDRYIIHGIAKFKGIAGTTVDGLLPLHYPNEMFETSFTVNWNFGNETEVPGGDPILRPDDTTAEKYDYFDLVVDTSIPGNEGWCQWTQFDRVDCRGKVVLPGVGYGTHRTVEVWFNFTADNTTIVAPTPSGPRTRNHIFNDQPYTDPIGPVPLLIPPGQTFSVRVTDEDRGTPGTCLPLGSAYNCGWVEAVPTSVTLLRVNKFEGIRYEIGVPNELPRWFVDNNWHHFVYGAISGAHLAATAGTSGSGACTTPPSGFEPNDCLTVQFNGAMVREDVEALVVGTGTMLTTQDRTTASTLCSGQSPPKPAIFCDYFEAPNSDDESPSTRNLIFGRASNNTFSVSNTFNDHLRAVPP